MKHQGMSDCTVTVLLLLVLQLPFLVSVLKDIYKKVADLKVI
jgi:hypothetical protein